MSSKRVQAMGESVFTRLFALAKDLKNPCNLSYGQPHFDVPEVIKEAAIEAIRDGKNAYTPAQGIEPLRQKVLESYAKRGVPQEECLVTMAVSGAFYLSVMATCDVGDELIIPDPYFIFWKDLPVPLGVKPVYVDTYPDFRWRRDRLEAAITPKTKAIILSAPGNPTGVTATKEELEMIAEVARKHDLWVFYDEIYSLFKYDGDQLNMSAFYPEKTITMGGFSKNYGMTGWRLGHIVGPKKILGHMLNLQWCSAICPPSPLQFGAIEALDFDMGEHVAEYKQKRDFLYGAISPHYNVVKPEGAIYLFAEVPAGMTGTQFAEAALEEELILIPGCAFSQKDTHVRISYAATDEQLKRGADILVRMAKKYARLSA